MRLTIVTGASRGMGAAIASQALARGDRLLCLSRGRNDALAAQAQAAGAICEQWAIDLVDAAAAAERLEGWLAALDGAAFTDASLINNAATLTRIGPVDAVDAVELARGLRVGLEAPLLLSAAFLRATREWRAERRVLNVSSGLGRRAMAGQATYCAVKAGLDHLSRAMALDEALRPNGAKVVALAPGVIDTDMQTQLRAGDAAGFPDRGAFVGLKERGELTSADAAAARVLAWLDRADFGTEPVADVRDA